MTKNSLVLIIGMLSLYFSCSEDPVSSYRIPNTAPTALFTVDQDSGTTAILFVFNATASFDKEDSASGLKAHNILCMKALNSYIM